MKMRKRIGLIIDRWRRYKRINVPSGEALFFIVILFLSYWMRLGGVCRNHIPQLPIFIASSGLRLAFRMFYFPQLKRGKGKRALIVGAGAAGELLVREMQTSALY